MKVEEFLYMRMGRRLYAVRFALPSGTILRCIMV